VLLFCVGGLSVSSNDSDSDNFSSRALRRTRIDLIVRDYEVSSNSTLAVTLSWVLFLLETNWWVTNICQVFRFIHCTSVLPSFYLVLNFQMLWMHMSAFLQTMFRPLFMPSSFRLWNIVFPVYRSPIRTADKLQCLLNTAAHLVTGSLHVSSITRAALGITVLHCLQNKAPEYFIYISQSTSPDFMPNIIDDWCDMTW